MNFAPSKLFAPVAVRENQRIFPEIYQRWAIVAGGHFKLSLERQSCSPKAGWKIFETRLATVKESRVITRYDVPPPT